MTTDDGLRGPAGVTFAGASRLDGRSLAEGIRLLERVAGYVESRDDVLTARGQAPGVAAWRRFEAAYVVGVLGLIAVIIVGTFVLTAVL